MVSGHVLYAALPGIHFWAEAWMEDRGWMPYDFFGWALSAGGRDEQWLGMYAGALDYRMKFQVFPHQCTGPGSIRFPRWWHMTACLSGEGLAAIYQSAPAGELIYRDRCSILA
jgi:hypothetical protein